MRLAPAAFSRVVALAFTAAEASRVEVVARRLENIVAALPLRAFLCAALCVTTSAPAHAVPLSAASRARIASGQTISVIVEFDASDVDQSASLERDRRRLWRDDAAIKSIRAQGYRSIKHDVDV